MALNHLSKEQSRLEIAYAEESARTRTDLLQSTQQILCEGLKRSNLDYMQSNLSSLRKESIRAEKELNVLGRLQYRSMTARHSKIATAHAQTFSWIFGRQRDQTNAPCPDIPFLQWLKTGDGIFWISGKAGSGKSTLMKFLSNEPDTERALRQWAHERCLLWHFSSSGALARTCRNRKTVYCDLYSTAYFDIALPVWC